MQRKNGTDINLGKTVSPFDSTGTSSAIDETVSNFLNTTEKVQKNDNADIAKYIPGTLDLVLQRMLEDIDTKEQPAHFSYKDMEYLEFQTMLINNYYTNPNSMHICFLMKIKKVTNNDTDIDTDLVTVNKFFSALDKRNKLY